MVKRQINSDIKTFDVTAEIGVTDSERTELTVLWFKVAEDNLSTAKLLYTEEKYHHCVFFLQQCIECIVKGILLESKIIDNAKTFGHSPEAALEELYRLQDSDLLKYCEYIKNEMSDKHGFENRLIHMACIYNNFVRAHKNSLIEHAPSDFAVNPDIYDKVRLFPGCPKDLAYHHIQRMINTNIYIYCFAILFSVDQQTTRYPINEDDVWLPADKYKVTQKTKEGIESIIKAIGSIIRTVAG